MRLDDEYEDLIVENVRLKSSLHKQIGKKLNYERER